MKSVSYELLNYLSKNDDTVIFSDGSSKFTANQFKNLIGSFVLRMREVGIWSGSCVGLHSTDLIIGSALALAASYIGCSWANITLTTLKHCKLTHCVYYSDQEVVEDGPNVYKVDSSWVSKEGFVLEQPDTDPDSIWLYAESSGTTGEPKLIPITHNEFSKRSSYGQEDFFKSMRSMISLYHPLKSTVQYRAPVAIMRNITIDISQELKDKIMVAGSLRQIKLFLENKPIPKTPFNSLVSPGGAAVSRKDCEYLLQYFKIVRIPYSATEISRIAQKDITHIDQYNGSVGKLIPGTTIKFPEDNSMPFRIFSDKKDNHLGSILGDIGYMKDDELYITGRYDDIINIDGIKLNPSQIEHEIESNEGVDQCMVFDDDGVFSALIVGNIDPESIVISLYKPKKFYLVDKLPYNKNGKLLRREGKAYIRA